MDIPFPLRAERFKPKKRLKALLQLHNDLNAALEPLERVEPPFVERLERSAAVETIRTF
jgi:hypothetical protein